MEEIDHPLYTKASLQEADGVAWIFTSKESQMVKYPFKFPEMEPAEVRLKVLHVSLCYSDVMHVRGYWCICLLM
jgi:D-arabinose 1-dehydrogenase-like Zn-dependent alcohol dehydrogenase